MEDNVVLLFQYCEYYPNYEKCKEWLAEHLPDEFDKMALATGGKRIVFLVVGLDQL